MSYAKTEEIIQKSRETLEITKDNRDYSTGIRETEKIIKGFRETKKITKKNKRDSRDCDILQRYTKDNKIS